MSVWLHCILYMIPLFITTIANHTNHDENFEERSLFAYDRGFGSGSPLWPSVKDRLIEQSKRPYTEWTIKVPLEDINRAFGQNGLNEGDIELRLQQPEDNLKKVQRTRLGRWKEVDGFPLIPYFITKESENDEAAIKAGIKMWTDSTCVKFEQRMEDPGVWGEAHVAFIKDEGCYSYLGRRFYTIIPARQPISIGTGCGSPDIVAHEVGHALGLEHEQSRPDRKDYVDIIYGNMEFKDSFYFSRAVSSRTYDIEYDYSSIMHYSSHAFSNNGRPTIVPKVAIMETFIGERDEPSFRDVLVVNKHYGCIDKWMSKCGISSNPCQNGGSIKSDCSCHCPPNTSGTNCETITGEYYGNLPCNEVITTDGTTLMNPGFSVIHGLEHCTWVLQAPTGMVPRFTMRQFKSFQKEKGVCYFQSLEIRTDGTPNGEWFCENDLSGGEVFTGCNSDRNIVINWRSRVYNSDHGFKGQLSFVSQTEC